MMPLPKKVLAALTSVQDIEDALDEKGFVMSKYVLRDYGALIRRLRTEGGAISGSISDTTIEEIISTKQFAVDPHHVFNYMGKLTFVPINDEYHREPITLYKGDEFDVDINHVFSKGNTITLVEEE